MLENKLFEGIHYSRYGASYAKACAECGTEVHFREMCKWLMGLEINGKHMDWDTAYEIAELTTNGKLELESSARKWMENRMESMTERERYKDSYKM